MRNRGNEPRAVTMAPNRQTGIPFRDHSSISDLQPNAIHKPLAKRGAICQSGAQCARI
jgi:hypothetical protein